MTDGGHVPNEGLPEHLLPETGTDPAQGGGGWVTDLVGQAVPVGAPGPGYTFIDQPDRVDQLDDEDDVLLMPGPQGSWSDASTAPVVPLGEALAPQGVPGYAVYAAADGSVAFPSANAAVPPVAQPVQLVQPVPVQAVPDLTAGPMAVVAAESQAAPIQLPAAPVPPAAVPQQPGVPGLAAVPPIAPVFAQPDAVPVASAPVATADQAPTGVPVEPSWPPLDLPVQAAGEASAPGIAQPEQPAPAQVAAPQVQVPQPQAPQAAAAPSRRPLHAGPPIPDPSVMTGQVPVRSLADRGPSEPGGTPPHGIPVAAPVQVAAVLVAAPAPVEPSTETVVIPAQSVASEPQSVVPAPVEAAPAETAPLPESVPQAQALPVEVAAPAEAAQPVVPAEAAEAAAPVAELAEVMAPAPVTEALAVATEASIPDVPSAEAATSQVAEPVAAEPSAAPQVPVADPAAEVRQPEVVEVPAPVAPPRRIAAFLADPAPLGLSVPEVQTPEVQTPAAPPAEQAPAEAPAAEAPIAETPAVEAPPTVAAPAIAPVADAPSADADADAATDDTATDAVVPEAAVATDAPSAEAAAVPEAPEAAKSVEPVESVEPAPAEAPALAEAPEPIEPAAPRPPAAPGYADPMREAVHQVMRERRDIRNGFRPDPVPHEVLLRVLEAAHTAPSVGYSQPWDFVVIRSAETRRKMHALAERQREAYADSLPKGRAKQFKEIKIEAILDTPVNIVVTADRTRGGRHTLGRHTQPQMAPYSAALAVENLWLAARAEGLGVGWVSFFDEEEMVRELGLPEHLEVVAYLCVGFVDSFPDEPELQQQGWAKKRPLSWVVHEEQYGNRALPGEAPHSVLSETLRTIRPLDAKALGLAWDRQKRMTKPAGSLGMLEIISAQLSGLSRKCPPPIPEPACVAIFAGDHGVHAQGVTPWPQEVTAQMVANFLAGGAVVNAFAAQVGAEVCVVDIGVKADLPEAIQQGRTTGLLPRKVKPGTDDMTQGPAMTREEALKALEIGIETARDLVAAGNKILITGDMGIANTTASAALISVFTGADPTEVTGRGTGIDDETHARKVDVIRRALELHKPDPSDPIGVLAAVGGLEHAAIAGFLLGAASLRTPVILDGVIAGSAALAAKAIAPEVLAACIAGHRSAEPGHQAALAKIGLRPLIDLDLRLGEGTGALLALPLVQSAARAMHDVATFDSAGVTEKG
ncbi:nicotinate-nucleotide--dimethylbenzimidazole phosphoribosyltransferase [Kitasatospora sp. GAS1066B]|uniref:nicotinate-nucleotide--dimethylbenzimidazole phosphoribosyltransferase n=1 Tax=Kitasatospora sp. GAS1066B TaxID=3156271 RepID=UPI003515B7F8